MDGDDGMDSMLEQLVHARPESLISIAIVIAGILAKQWMGQRKNTQNRIGRRASDIEYDHMQKQIDALTQEVADLKAQTVEGA